MAAGRSQKLLASRRRLTGEDDENDEGSVVVEESQSEGSVLSESDDDEEDASSSAERRPAGGPPNDGDVIAPSQSASALSGARHPKKSRDSRKQGGKKHGAEADVEGSTQPAVFKATADTEAMMNGLKIDDRSQDAVDYEDTNVDPAASSSTYPIATSHPRNQTPLDRQKREREEYRKKKDSDPAFIPNRGNFFMHDTRGQQGGQGPILAKGPMAGRGRGRGGPQAGGPFSPAGQVVRANKTSEQPWKHDLHEAINDAPQSAAPDPIPGYLSRDEVLPARSFAKAVPQQKPASSAPISFSSTITLGRVQLRVYLPNMKAPITYSEVPAKKYVRLPDHRPPLRRDKPVRIFLPHVGPKYIFPATERSFIFIPRQMRPNQRGFANNYQRSAGGYGHSSRRTSIYGGSMYSGSVAPSRRSSITRDRENMFSPGSFASGFQPPSRPVVRLPHGGPFFSNSTSPAAPLSGQHTPTMLLHTYPLPQQPTFQGTPTTTVQHPRPQKAISVSGIESPAVLGQQQTPANQQPFHSQLPAHMAEQTAYQQQQPPPNPSYYSPNQQYMYPGGPAPQAGTPLSRIPEHAIRGQTFPPHQAMYYAPYAGGQPQYFHPDVPMPMYTMPQQQAYGMPPSTQPPSHPQSVPGQQAPTEQAGNRTPAQHQSQQQPHPAQTGMVAHESNGMVYYLPASEAAAQSSSAEQQYQPAEGFVPSYAMPGLPPPTPAPDASGYSYVDMGGIQGVPYYQPMQQGQ